MDVAHHGAASHPLVLALLGAATGGASWWATGYAMASDPHVQEFVHDAATTAMRKTKEFAREVFDGTDAHQYFGL